MKREKNTIEIMWSEMKINNKKDENNAMYNSRLLVDGWNNIFKCYWHFYDGQG